jgi:hypothetical protein
VGIKPTLGTSRKCADYLAKFKDDCNSKKIATISPPLSIIPETKGAFMSLLNAMQRLLPTPTVARLTLTGILFAGCGGAEVQKPVQEQENPDDYGNLVRSYQDNCKNAPDGVAAEKACGVGIYEQQAQTETSSASLTVPPYLTYNDVQYFRSLVSDRHCEVICTWTAQLFLVPDQSVTCKTKLVTGANGSSEYRVENLSPAESKNDECSMREYKP